MNESKSIIELIQNSQKDLEISEGDIVICDLNKIDDSCPWKKFEGYSIDEFFENNFAEIENLLTEKKGYFTDFLKGICEDIAFAKYKVDEYSNEYEWATIYKLKEEYSEIEEETLIPYLIAGEPYIESSKELDLKNRLGADYPKLYNAFWSTHSFWHGEALLLDECDFEITNDISEIIYYEYIKSPKYFLSQKAQELIYNWREFKKDKNGNYSNLYFENINEFYNDKDGDQDELCNRFAQNELKKGVLFEDTENGNCYFFVKDTNNKIAIAECVYDGFSTIHTFDKLETYIFEWFNKNLAEEEERKGMEEENKILEILSKWSYENNSKLVLDDEFECSSKLKEPDCIDSWFDAQLDNEMADEEYNMLDKEFLSFAYTGEGGEYYLWLYDELEGSPPVIYLGSSGEYDMVAPSLNDFVCMLGHGKIFSADYKTLLVTWEDYHEEDKDKYLLDCQKFINQFKGLIQCSDFEISMKRMSEHKSFKKMVDDFVKRNS